LEKVSEERFLEILNERLVAHPRANNLAPFVATHGGYDWPKDNIQDQSIYIEVAQQVQREFGVW
jgi:hypothetical protein